MLPQSAVDELGHLRLGVLLAHAMRDAPIYIRYFEALDAIVGDVGHQVHVFNVELAVLLAFGKHLAEQLHLSQVEMLAHLLDHPDVAEELGPQIAVAHHSLTDHAQVGVNQLDDLLLRADLAGGNLVKFVAETFKLSLNDGIVDVLLRLEIGVECAPAFARSLCNVVHRRVLKAVLGKQLPGHID